MVRYGRWVIPCSFPEKIAEHVKMCQTLKLSRFVLIERYYCLPHCSRLSGNESNAF